MSDAEFNKLRDDAKAAWTAFLVIGEQHTAAKDKWYPLQTRLEKEQAKRAIIAEMQASGELPKPLSLAETGDDRQQLANRAPAASDSNL